MKSGPQPLIYVVDDDDGVRMSLSMLLDSVGFEVQGFGDPHRFLEVIRLDRPGCVVLDLRMPALNGLEVLSDIRKRTSSLPVIMISAHAEVETAVQAMKFGACDFIQKPYSGDILLGRIQGVVKGHIKDLAKEREKRRILRCVATLSEREIEVLVLLARGCATKVIASKLAISAKTVDNHRTSLLKKTGTHSAIELARIAALGDLVDLTETESAPRQGKSGESA